MQTFIPYASVDRCAQVLDNVRLGKQRVEVYQILRSLRGITNGWRNTRQVRMWEGHENFLAVYGIAMCAEWLRRGKVEETAPKIRALADLRTSPTPPRWWGDEEIHASHRGWLHHKSPELYPDWAGEASKYEAYVFPELAMPF